MIRSRCRRAKLAASSPPYECQPGGFCAYTSACYVDNTCNIAAGENCACEPACCSGGGGGGGWDPCSDADDPFWYDYFGDDAFYMFLEFCGW